MSKDSKSKLKYLAEVKQKKLARAKKAMKDSKKFSPLAESMKENSKISDLVDKMASVEEQELQAEGEHRRKKTRRKYGFDD